MYSVDGKDKVVELENEPLCDVGAPLPTIIADEHNLWLLYIGRHCDPDWDGTYVNVVSPDSEGLPIVKVEFKNPYCHMFGPPNDEAFSGHPLASRGLKPYGVFEVLNSSWVRGLEQMNSVHPYHSKSMFADRRHFIFSFHDSTLEVVAKGYETRLVQSSIQSELLALLTRPR